jgi:hypothetical protein
MRILPVIVLLIPSLLTACTRPDKKLAQRIQADLNAKVRADCSLGECEEACEAIAAAHSLMVECRANPSDGIEAKKYLTNACGAMRQVGLQDAELEVTSPETGDIQQWTADDIQNGECQFVRDF